MHIAVGCVVMPRGAQAERLRVEEVEDGAALVRPLKGGGARWTPISELRSGFARRMVVQDVPLARTRRPLGVGEVAGTRTLGHHDQVLVEFYDSGERHWLPFHNLCLLKGPKQRLLHDPFEIGQAERFRLKALAHALTYWNANTGALSRLDIDPLPHQIHLVHDILASGTLNWLIADDVGLGKTIEVGMLLHALAERRGYDRTLIVTPAGLTRQWQEELSDKFSMDDYRIYGRDFEINDAAHWRLYPRVIASIDRLKGERHLEALAGSGDWDLIVFDEAHRLTRRQFGRKFDASDRYRLAAALRGQTDNLLFLTATPHQGREDLFRALLELLRPEWQDQIRRLSEEPTVIREMVYRNRKSDVTDADGAFIFHGQQTSAVKVDCSPIELAFDQALQDYIRRGYEAAAAAGRPGRAIGFVMTIYRKLAASSSAAILRALERRLANLEDEAVAAALDQDELDDRFEGEHEEHEVTRADAARPFFHNEFAALEQLVEQARALLPGDTKLRALLEDVIPTIEVEDAQEHLVIFTEYRGTQDHVAAALRARYGEASVTLIHGGMSLDDRRDSVARFREGDARFMVSTEAGGEGINLHHRCHILVNYDIPWNPMRIVQRIGRLYRYGQALKVLVFNLHAPGTIDGHIVSMMYDRIERVVRDMAGLGEEYDERMFAEIFGDVIALTDLEAVVEDAKQSGLKRTEERVQEALERAREAQNLQEEVFAAAQRFDPNEIRGELRVGEEHLRGFVLGMLALLDCEVLETTHAGDVWDVRISESLAAALKQGRRRMRLTASRRLARGDIAMMDFDSPLFQLLMERAKHHDFGGLHALVVGAGCQALVTARLRWQNDQGRKLREEFVALSVDSDGSVRRNAAEISEWLERAAVDGTDAGSRDQRVAAIDAALKACADHLAAGSNLYVHPMQAQTIAAAWSSPRDTTSSD
ncbi:MAG: helicase [Deltaproteobacteria bacterium HGW-Deltaproteobacteria-14]|jgi:superfamily II DNA or RNA helicase|nr:MAG: helicase [Deltaproteobacteria bacterium HGW-Deltaproteobacteria-14]